MSANLEQKMGIFLGARAVSEELHSDINSDDDEAIPAPMPMPVPMPMPAPEGQLKERERARCLKRKWHR